MCIYVFLYSKPSPRPVAIPNLSLVCSSLEGEYLDSYFFLVFKYNVKCTLSCPGFELV